MITYAGIIGPTPEHHPGPVQADRFDRLQSFVGRLEDAPAGQYPALHAACHALMNGIGRVILAGVRRPYDASDWIVALRSVFRSDPLPVVVAPGGPPRELAAAFREMPFASLSCLWVDAQPEGGEDERVRVASQQVPTTSPGRRDSELLPASALIAPLHIGTADRLRGIHGPPIGPGPLAADSSGRIVLARPLSPPGTGLRPREPSAHSPVEFRINAALAHMAKPILLRESAGPALYARLEREAAAILEELRRRGDITRFAVRCDAATSAGEPGPVVEVQFTEPRRAETVVLRVGRLE